MFLSYSLLFIAIISGRLDTLPKQAPDNCCRNSGCRNSGYSNSMAYSDTRRSRVESAKFLWKSLPAFFGGAS
jgi:hypothetical protein